MSPSDPSTPENESTPAVEGAPAVEDTSAVAHTRSIAVDAAASVAARLVAMAASSATALIIIASLSKHQYGAYALAAGLVGVLAVALDVGTTSSLARYVAQGRGSGRLITKVVSLRIGLLSFGAVIVAIVGLLRDWESLFGQLLLPAAALLIVQGGVNFLYGSLPAMRRISLLLVVTVLQPLVELVGVLYVRSSGGGAAQMLLATAIAAGAATLIGYITLAFSSASVVPQDVKSSEPPANVGDVFHYGRRLFLVLLLMMVFGQLDQFVIAFFHNEATVAPYALVVKLQALLIAPIITAVAIIAPRIAGAGEFALATYRQWLGFFVVLYAGAVGVMAVLAQQVFTAVNPEYRGDWGILVALLPFMFLAGIANLPSVTLNQTGYASSRVKISVIALLINAVLDLLLVPSLAAYGAAIATTAAFAYYTWAHHVLVERSLAKTAAPTATLLPLLARGVFLIAAMIILALILQPLALSLGGGLRSQAVKVVLAAGGIPAILHIAGTVKLLRRHYPTEGL